MNKKRVGLFGGTFNPVHLGHLRGAEEVRERCALEQVIFIPSSLPPHKKQGDVIEGRHRLEMVQRATATNPHFSVSTIEMERVGPSYSIDTLRYFREKLQGTLHFILGREALLEIETWKDFQELFSLCHFVVMARPGFGKTPLSEQLPGVLVPAFRHDTEAQTWVHRSGQTLTFVETVLLDISSTLIRERIGRGRSVRYLVPGEVEAYLQEHRLYRTMP